MGLLAPLELVSESALAWLDLVPLSGMGYIEFNSAQTEKNIRSDQSYFKSHTTIGDGAIWEKHVEAQFDNFERENFSPIALLHAKSQSWAKLKLLRTPLEAATGRIAFILCELRGEKQVPLPSAPRPFDYEGLKRALASDDPFVSQEAKYTLSIIEKRLYPGRPMQPLNDGMIDMHATLANARQAAMPASDPCVTREIRRPPVDTSKLHWKAPKIVELADYRQSNDERVLVQEEKDSTATNVVRLKPDLKPVASHEASYVKLKLAALFSDGDRASYETQKSINASFKDKKAIEDELQRRKGVNLSASDKDGKWVEAIKGQVKRCCYLQRVYKIAATEFPKGFVVPLDPQFIELVRQKLGSSNKLPTGAVKLFVERLVIALRHLSD